MADIREYIVQKSEDGVLHISEDVLSTVAALAIADVEGVGGHVTRTRGVKTHTECGRVTVDIWIRVIYGFSIPAVAQKVQAAVIEGIDAMTGLRVETVRVHVNGVEFPESK